MAEFYVALALLIAFGLGWLLKAWSGSRAAIVEAPTLKGSESVMVSKCGQTTRRRLQDPTRTIPADPGRLTLGG